MEDLKKEKELELLRLAHDELLELRGCLCNRMGMFDIGSDVNIDKLYNYWNRGKSEWEKALEELKGE